ncbi:hypothetical protein BSKO_00290 [Bryopsis sp. KO-2023]|nr:hypothetical protein BSKO_00290 [Bryopsis sp. KO-2023]
MSAFRRRKNGGEEDDGLRESLLPSDENVDSTAPQAVEGLKESTSVGDQHNVLVRAVMESWNCLLALLAFLLGQHGHLTLTSTQEARLRELRRKCVVPYDDQNPDHLESLKSLWMAGFPDTPWNGVKSPKWKEMGWQGVDPGTDFRGGGLFSLSNLLYMANHESTLFEKLMKKSDGDRVEWEYPFAAAGVNVTVHLVDSVKLRIENPPSSPHRRGFVKLLNESDSTFEEVYCCTFELLDKVWLEMHASYMEFPTVLKRTIKQVEEALGRQPVNIADLRKMLDLKT